MSQKKENKPCNQFEQGQGKQKKARSQQQVSERAASSAALETATTAVRLEPEAEWENPRNPGERIPRVFSWTG